MFIKCSWEISVSLISFHKEHSMKIHLLLDVKIAEDQIRNVHSVAWRRIFRVKKNLIFRVW